MPFLNHFDILAPIYDRVFKPSYPDKLFEYASLPTKGTLLDAGGGTGRIARYSREKAKQVVVVDLSERMLHQAKKMDDLQLVCSHVETLPFPSLSFNRIIMIDAFHHVCDQKKTAQELWRILDSGGRIVIEEPDIRSIPVKIVAVFEKLALMRSHFMNPIDIGNLFAHLDSKVEIICDNYTSWIVINKS
ncbi:MAG: class I SAM-dependent methyltransferase [Anaerolineales bacterium]|jgi:demethylmenaquinone methyltransferase/2-methoxy-6-polyprenyl-1,4-benzoquinol methylase